MKRTFNIGQQHAVVSAFAHACGVATQTIYNRIRWNELKSVTDELTGRVLVVLDDDAKAYWKSHQPKEA